MMTVIIYETTLATVMTQGSVGTSMRIYTVFLTLVTHMRHTSAVLRRSQLEHF